MERKSLDGLPTIVADTESLQQQLRELHAAVKARNAQRQEQAQTAGVGMVIRGK
jgi:hypothetical protein